ncbi:MAG: ATP-binding protein [Coriobacteriales bacterium]|jgi:anti-sigma regulatory factor (Ser/Thr protein kinase)|nr:ATP-binding protein [Coriobacteriales bacterium]
MDDSSLIDFIEEVSGEVHLRVEENLGDGFVRLRSAEAERRQAKHDIRSVEDIVIEMLRNARDAQAEHIFIATTRDSDVRLMTVLDDGGGVPDALHDLIFEPRVTSKLDSMVIDDWGVHGRGMALFSIRSNVDDIHVCSSQPGGGTAIAMRINTGTLAERSDQSTLPQIEKDAEGVLRVLRGPHNMVRCATEFALANRGGVSVYLGSPSEIVATLIAHGQQRLPREDLLFCTDPRQLAVCERLAACSDATELVSASATLGLELSERTAHRIINRQISLVRPLPERLLPRRGATAQKDVDLTKDARGLKIATDDLESFSRALERAFEPLAQQYYLSLADLPRITVKGDTVTVRFQIEKEA